MSGFVYALDPLYLDGVGLAEVLITLGKVLVAFLVLLVSVIFMVWFERKVIADMQNRIGPNRAGPFGLLQTLADGLKLIVKEDLIPSRARRFVFVLAPFLSVIPAFLVFAVVPLGGTFTADDPGIITIAGHETFAQLADPPIGVLWILAVSSIGVYGVMLAGWASGSKYPLLGSVRASAQMVSYEAAMGLSVATLIMTTGGLSTRGMVAVQAGDGFAGFVPNWNVILTGIVPFAIFFVAALAETNRPPFDLVEAEQELVGGFHTEYSSIRFGMFYVAEFMHPVTMSAVIVTLWFGGPAGPHWFGPVSGIVWLVAKIFVFLYIFVLIRGTLPRFRYDQLMDLGWKVLIPLQLGWLLLLAALNVGRDLDWNYAVVIGVGFFVIGGLTFLLLSRASEVSRQRRELGEVEA
ncbi:MAG TPA: NADH-quinone oxidoreductase subunit NuoH [Acidimicrobiales bacterium]|nr:NADH-quinone oxidoreductase subunit NuoH [Acidimicrobiales bacterium]